MNKITGNPSNVLPAEVCLGYLGRLCRQSCLGGFFFSLKEIAQVGGGYLGGDPEALFSAARGLTPGKSSVWTVNSSRSTSPRP